MFGSKLRSWMENHIVRPRKKGNKNKNGNSSNLASTNGTPNVHKGTGVSMYPGDITTAASTNSVSSPARRSEVSPIQSHTNRIGWQSPQQESAVSPKSDHFLYMHSVKSHTLSSTSSLSTTAAITISSATAKTKTLSPNSMPRKSSYYYQDSASSQRQLLPSSHNHQQQNHHSFHNHNNHHNHNSYAKQDSQHNNLSNNHMLSASPAYATSATTTTTTVPAAGSTQPNLSANNHICTNTNQSLAQHDINLKNNNNNNNSNDSKRKNIVSSQKQQEIQPKIETKYQNGSVPHMDENRYGKILPSKKVSTSSDNFSTSIGSYDNINANIQFQTNGKAGHEAMTGYRSGNNNNSSSSSSASSVLAVVQYPKQNCIGNGPNFQIQQQTQQQQQQQHQQPQPPHHHQHHHHHHHHHSSGQIQPPRNGSETNRNMLRTNRYNSGAMLGPTSNHPLAHVINTLSSPESAYSTGYSTDGTSPGATYTPPEYYINMRTGTHYFPKGVNSLAIEANRYKFGLNKIEEMSPVDPLPNSHRRTESFDMGQNKIPGFGIPDPDFFKGQGFQCSGTSPVPQRSIAPQNYKGFESPSPRQRCRIRTNPWYSTTETSSSGSSTFLTKKVEIDASSSSSGIKSSSDAGASDKNEEKEKSSDSETSSSTEVEVAKISFSPGTIRRRKITDATKSEPPATHSGHQDSDEDATLNEMMGKFDESYVYEKETDILSSSDSDPTDCASDLDTGQDAGDECDTDELLDIDFIDNGSIQEIVENDPYKNTGSCSYFSYQLERRASRMRRTRKQTDEASSSKRRKRLMKTRKKSADSKDKHSPIRNSRESRSLGGTPVCLRRNQSVDSKKYDSLDLEIYRFNRDFSRTSKITPLTNRSNSLTFTEVHAVRGRFLAIAESEKALLKADLEADVKYKQLIHEAETILVSMKTSALRETPVASPRRVCNVPTNKRVEMLRNCEADLKRELAKQPKPVETTELPNPPTVEGIIINKRLEMLKYETNSAPNSPKCGRFSPRKTHVTNFINQNVPPMEVPRRNSIPEPPIKSPQLQLNGRTLRSPPTSPVLTRRRVRSQSPRVTIYSDSDSDEDNSKKSIPQRRPCKPISESEMNGNRKNDLNERVTRRTSQKMRDLKDDLSNRNIVLEIEKMSIYDESDYANRNIADTKKPPLMSFRSIDMGNRTSINTYCPQSEPLKRKIYKGSSTFERIKKSLDMDSEIPKKAILEKITNMRKERQALKSSSIDSNQPFNTIQEPSNDDESTSSNISTKHQLILNTIEDLKRSLEDQSIELCGLNDEDE